ncbi:MAG: tyrosine-type recombinase/integrase [Acidobacteriota bacterium]|nr:tyrosine-type recombinase/integrase [Acidobacteriota bacterium]
MPGSHRALLHPPRKDRLQRSNDPAHRQARCECGDDLPSHEPHILRHTFAVLWIHKGGSTLAPQLMLGHDHLATTEIYLDVSPELVLHELPKVHRIPDVAEAPAVGQFHRPERRHFLQTCRARREGRRALRPRGCSRTCPSRGRAGPG